jgi:hypothetical protein
MQRRQETERQALQREHARQQRQLESRHFRQREEFRGPEARSNALGRGGVETRPDGRFAGTPGSQGRGMRR